MERRIQIALLVVGAVGFYACTDGPVALNDVSPAVLGNPEGGSATLPHITGGGITQNDNSGAGPGFVTIGGFSAQATGPVSGGVYPATGQVQAKSVPDDLGRLHAQVVCIANLGPSGGVDGGGDPDNDVWEIRIRVTKFSPSGPELGFHGSVFVQDNGTGSGMDFADENFDAAALGSSTCGVTTSFQLEPVLHGSIEVHDQG